MIRMSRGTAKRLPGGILDRGGIAVETPFPNCGDRSPENVLPFPVPTRNKSVGHDHVDKRVEPSRPMEVVPFVRLKEAGDPAPGVIGRLKPEMGDMRLVGRSRSTVGAWLSMVKGVTF
jgi:hypothetical protein